MTPVSEKLDTVIANAKMLLDTGVPPDLVVLRVVRDTVQACLDHLGPGSNPEQKGGE